MGATPVTKGEVSLGKQNNVGRDYEQTATRHSQTPAPGLAAASRRLQQSLRAAPPPTRAVTTAPYTLPLIQLNLLYR